MVRIRRLGAGHFISICSRRIGKVTKEMASDVTVHTASRGQIAPVAGAPITVAENTKGTQRGVL
jgi:hypothetical protein